MTLKDGGGITVYTEVTSVSDDLISFTLHYVFDDGEELGRLRRHAVPQRASGSRGSAGGRLQQRSDYGDWKAVGSTDGEPLVLAYRERPEALTFTLRRSTNRQAARTIPH